MSEQKTGSRKEGAATPPTQTNAPADGATDETAAGENAAGENAPDSGKEPEGPNASAQAIDFAKEHNIDLATITGTGTDGAIGIGDVRDEKERLEQKVLDDAAAEREAALRQQEQSAEKEDRVLASIRGVTSVSRVAVPGANPSVVVGRVPSSITVSQKEALEKAAKAGQLGALKRDNLFFQKQR